MTNKIKAPKIKLRGIALYARTDRAYTFSQAEQKTVPDDDGKISTSLVVSGEQAEKIIGAVTGYAQELGVKLNKLKNLPWKDEIDRETDEPTGNTVFSAWQYGKDKDGNVRRMAHYDSKGKPLGKDFRLTSGSEVILAVRPSYYKGLGGGICLYLDAVQVVKYRQFESNPFDAVEDGEYEAEDNASDDIADDSDDDHGEEAGSTDF